MVALVVKFLWTLLLTAFVCGGAAAQASTTEDATEPRILAIGDSLMAWHRGSGKSIPDIVARELEEPAVNRAVSAARMIFKVPLLAEVGMQIPNQFRGGEWDWVIINGGGNDLWFGCGCGRCDAKMDKLIAPDGDSGAMPDLVSEIRETGAKVLIFGYLRSPGVDSVIEECRDEGDELEARYTAFAKSNKGVFFHSNADMVPEGDLSYHGVDRIHPSVKASEEIGVELARLIRKYDRTR